MSILTHAARWLRRRAPRGQAGFELTGMLVAMAIAVIAAAAGITLLVVQTNVTSNAQASANTMAELQDASTMLLRDVTDGSRITAAAAGGLTVQVVRDEVCTSRAWTVEDDELVVTTDTFTTERCAGGSVSQRDVVVQNLTSATPFAFYSAMSQAHALPEPVAPTEINRVSWDLSATVARSEVEKSLASGAAFHAIGALDEGSGQVQVAKQPVLTLTWPLGKVEGFDRPTLSWTDPSPEVTETWTVYRVMNPEGGMGPAGDQNWRVLATLGASITTYMDTSLEDGNRAQYVVRATTSEGQPGPASNQVLTGLRPAKSEAVSADGQSRSIKLTWDQAVGAEAYDLYRTEDGSSTLGLYMTWDELKVGGARLVGADGTGTVTFTDDLDYGHTYRYAVVPINRWERLATTDSPTGQVADGTSSTREFQSRFARNVSAYAQAYTAPARPALAGVTAHSNWSNTISWDAASWTGYADASIDGVHRDRGWQYRENSSDESTVSGAAWRDPAAETAGTTSSTRARYTETGVGGQYRHYQVRTCNPSGCSPWSTTKRTLQRPPTPQVCTTSSVTTRSARVTIRPKDIPSTYRMYQLRGGTPAPGYEVARTGQSTDLSRLVNRLKDNTTQSFDTRAKNDAGWSPWADGCSVRTKDLAVAFVNGSYTGTDTRRIMVETESTNRPSGREVTFEVNGNKHTDTNNTVHNGKLDKLRHNTTYNVRAFLTDGVNIAHSANKKMTTKKLAVRFVDTGYAGTTTRTIMVETRVTNDPGGTVKFQLDGKRASDDNGNRVNGKFDPLRDGVTYKVTALATDGYNDVSASKNYRTKTLTAPTPSTPTCYASRDDKYAPTTVRFSSNGSLSRSSVYASYAGYWSASATRTNTVSDGYNSDSATSSNSCGITVETMPPPPSSGVSPGPASPQCTPYLSYGQVISGLDSAWSHASPGEGYTVGGSVSGVARADSGTYLSGTPPNVRCNFYRTHHLLDSRNNARSTWTLQFGWMSGGGTGIE